MSGNPYQNLPDHAFWRRAVAQVAPGAVDPAVEGAFTIAPGDAVFTAGSCFAQHIGSMLRAINFNFLVAEAAHPLASAELARSFNYGVFSARTGNVYTARQLLQLFHRAYGSFSPAEDVWEADGRFVDPFRPQIQPGGFLSRREFEIDRARHLATLRRAFETLDVFVFTLGLTESWRSRVDGAVFPLCPGVSGGVFDAGRHEFHNFTVAEVAADMSGFIDALRGVNPGCRVILTVSPVPLVATARADTHVLAATIYSKSVLRVAAEMVAQGRSGVAYFPSYEIITGRFDGGTYFAEDRRSVTGAGVAHVMRVFARCYANIAVAPPLAASPRETQSEAYMHQMEELMRVHCDEGALDPG
jgi:hypothetical protein